MGPMGVDEAGRLTFPPVSAMRSLDSQDVDIRDMQSVVSSSSPTEGKMCRNHMDKVDSAGCIITNVHRYCDQMAHWINVQRGDVGGQRDVEQTLIHYGIVPSPEFHLDNITNLSWLDASLHIGLAKYDLFAVTADLETCEKLKQFLVDDHARRQQIVDDGGPTIGRKYQKIGPDGFPLRRRDDGSNTYKSYIACNDGLFRETDDPTDISAPPFPAFQPSTTRTEPEQLNIWLIIINADCKFRRYFRNYGRETMHRDMLPIADATIAIVELIYKSLKGVSPRLTRKTPRQTSKVESYKDSSDTETKTKTEPGPSGKSRAEESVAMQVDADLDAFVKHYRSQLSQPAHERLSLPSILQQLSDEQSMALCREFFFPRDDDDDDDDDRLETLERERTSQYASEPATLQNWRENV